MFVASDTSNSAFQLDILLDHLARIVSNGATSCDEGARELLQPVQELNEGLYFPIPSYLEPSLAPIGPVEVRIEVGTDLIDIATSRVGLLGLGNSGSLSVLLSFF